MRKKGAVNYTVENSLMSGMDDGTLAPRRQTTRAEASAMLTNFCENVTK